MMLDGSFPARRAHPDTCRCRYIAAYATQLSDGPWWIASLKTGEYIFRAAALSHRCLYPPALCSTRVCRCDGCYYYTIMQGLGVYRRPNSFNYSTQYRGLHAYAPYVSNIGLISVL